MKSLMEIENDTLREELAKAIAREQELQGKLDKATAMAEVDSKFYKVAISERDLAQYQLSKLKKTISLGIAAAKAGEKDAALRLIAEAIGEEYEPMPDPFGIGSRKT